MVAWSRSREGYEERWLLRIWTMERGRVRRFLEFLFFSFLFFFALPASLRLRRLIHGCWLVTECCLFFCLLRFPLLLQAPQTSGAWIMACTYDLSNSKGNTSMRSCSYFSCRGFFVFGSGVSSFLPLFSPFLLFRFLSFSFFFFFLLPPYIDLCSRLFMSLFVCAVTAAHSDV